MLRRIGLECAPSSPRNADDRSPVVLLGYDDEAEDWAGDRS